MSITDGEIRQVSLHLKAALASLELAMHHGTANDLDMVIRTQFQQPLCDLIARVDDSRDVPVKKS